MVDRRWKKRLRSSLVVALRYYQSPLTHHRLLRRVLVEVVHPTSMFP